jgi:hypothetical protein
LRSRDLPGFAAIRVHDLRPDSPFAFSDLSRILTPF